MKVLNNSLQMRPIKNKDSSKKTKSMRANQPKKCFKDQTDSRDQEAEVLDPEASQNLNKSKTH